MMNGVRYVDLNVVGNDVIATFVLVVRVVPSLVIYDVVVPILAWK
jgi:hypothetical protein